MGLYLEKNKQKCDASLNNRQLLAIQLSRYPQVNCMNITHIFYALSEVDWHAEMSDNDKNQEENDGIFYQQKFAYNIQLFYFAFACTFQIK